MTHVNVLRAIGWPVHDRVAVAGFWCSQTSKEVSLCQLAAVQTLQAIACPQSLHRPGLSPQPLTQDWLCCPQLWTIPPPARPALLDRQLEQHSSMYCCFIARLVLVWPGTCTSLIKRVKSRRSCSATFWDLRVIEVHTSEYGTHLQSQLVTSGACYCKRQ